MMCNPVDGEVLKEQEIEEGRVNQECDIIENLKLAWRNLQSSKLLNADNGTQNSSEVIGGSTALHFSPIQEKIKKTIFSGKDLIYFGQSVSDWNDVTEVLSLHVTNFVLRELNTVSKNNSKLKKLNIDPGLNQESYRDQGFTRLKVLIIVPFRNDAYNYVNKIRELCPSYQIENYDHLVKTYSPTSQDGAVNPRKPDDYRRIFEGNIDEAFKLGIRFSRRKIRIFSNFYRSDIMIASPLGLNLASKVGETELEYDFLSCIEVLIFDHANILSMQNFENIKQITSLINRVPAVNRGYDFSRVKAYFINNTDLPRYRQTIFFSQYLTPEMNSFIKKNFTNERGADKIATPSPKSANKINTIVTQKLQVIVSNEKDNISTLRFEKFTQDTLPKVLNAHPLRQVVVFIPSSFDYVVLRKHCKDSEINAVFISEGLSQGHIARSRSAFASRRSNMLFITERMYFYWRYTLKNVEEVIFYGPPEVPEFYPEIINSIRDDTPSPVVTLLYSKYDYLSLERIFGSRKAAKLCSSTSVKSKT